jgi:hypothetical protein
MTNTHPSLQLPQELCESSHRFSANHPQTSWSNVSIRSPTQFDMAALKVAPKTFLYLTKHWHGIHQRIELANDIFLAMTDGLLAGLMVFYLHSSRPSQTMWAQPIYLAYNYSTLNFWLIARPQTQWSARLSTMPLPVVLSQRKTS